VDSSQIQTAFDDVFDQALVFHGFADSREAGTNYAILGELQHVAITTNDYPVA
jgi:hypothetical protein